MTDDLQPTSKAPAIDEILTALTGRSRIECIQNHICMTCGQPAEQFRDQLSLKEYTISGTCQKCQDSVFTNDNDTEDNINI